MDFISIGNLTIAAKWLILAGALFISYAVLKLQKKDPLFLDAISSSLLLGVIILKVSLVLVNPKLIIHNPLSLLYFTGGKIGFWLSIVIGSAYFFLILIRKKAFLKDGLHIYLVYVLYSFVLYHFGIVLMTQDWRHFVYLLIPYLFLIVFLIRKKEIKVLKNTAIITFLLGLAGWAVHEHQVKSTKEHAETIEVSGKTGIQKGEHAVDFTLSNLAGNEVRLSDYKGQKVILNFWATWCPPCKAEMPHMEAFYQNNNGENVVILAVNLTNSESNKEHVGKFVKDYGLSFPVLLDEQGEAGNVYQAFTIPTSYIIDTSGIIREKIVGPMSQETMENVIEKIN